VTYQVQKTRIRLLFSTLADATSANTVLLEGEKWQEKDAATALFTGRTKTGKNGVLSADKTTITGIAFNDLPFDPSGGGASLGDTTPQALGTAAAGTAATASRSDHRHAMPTAAQVGADAAGTAAAAVAAHAAAADPHPSYTTAIEAAAAAPVQSVAGRTGAVVLGVADVLGLGTAAQSATTDFATAAQGAKADTAVQPADLSGLLVKSSNLSDLNNTATARTNLGLTDTAAATPAGGLSIQSGNLVPSDVIKLVISNKGETATAATNYVETTVQRACTVTGAFWELAPSATGSSSSQAMLYARRSGTKTNLLSANASLAASAILTDATSLLTGTLTLAAGDTIGADLVSIGTGSSGHIFTITVRYS